MEFVFKHREYFLTHDLAEVPTKFVDRLGELSKGELKMGLVESMMRTSSIIGAAERFMWAVSPEQLPQPLDSISRQVPKGVEYRIISPDPPAKMGMLENRTLHSCPVVLALTEKEASVLFRLPDGRVDHAGFIGSDPEFLGWARDVFLHYWEYASARK